MALARFKFQITQRVSYHVAYADDAGQWRTRQTAAQDVADRFE
jgi:hypothetical protein